MKVVIPFFGHHEPLLVYERQPLLVGYIMLNERELATLADFRRLVMDAEIQVAIPTTKATDND